MENVATYVRPPTIEEWNETDLSVWSGQFVVAHGPAIIYREETHPPCFYFPPQQVNMELLTPTTRNAKSYCEFKGIAHYYDVLVPPDTDSGTGYIMQMAAWTYPEPFEAYKQLKDYIAFYPQKVGCYVGSELVDPEEEGDMFYGGWVWSGVSMGQ